MYADTSCWYAADACEMYAEQLSWNANPYNWQWYYPMGDLSLAQANDTKKRIAKRLVPAEIFANGTHCEVRKHARLGCAIVNFESEDLQAAVLKFLEIHEPGGEAVWTIGKREVTIRRHFDEHKNEFDRTGIFVHWGHKAEKSAPLPVTEVADHFDLLAQGVKVALDIGLQPPREDQVPCSRFSLART
eukprot:TRINITY_DN29324_c0_g1_i1.p1 TRINITY_DN29324_c0_g1~~TRINITY_DN29324_c0_g1_i1.p1  ORF type:complete len:188 (+),score=22.63 TRINITY_DN29324_c0_g1_i1:203-766(+)